MGQYAQTKRQPCVTKEHDNSLHTFMSWTRPCTCCTLIKSICFLPAGIIIMVMHLHR